MAEIKKTVKIKKHKVTDCEIHGFQETAPKIEQTKQPEFIDISEYKNRTDYK